MSVFAGEAVAGAWGRRRRRHMRERIPVVRTVWPRLGAVCVLVNVVPVALAVLALVAIGVRLLFDDVIGLGAMVIFGPVVVGGATVLLPVLGAAAATTRRAWTFDGSVRVELAAVGASALTLVGVVLVTTRWLPLLPAMLPGAALVAIAASPHPWQRPDAPPQMELSMARSTVNS